MTTPAITLVTSGGAGRSTGDFHLVPTGTSSHLTGNDHVTDEDVHGPIDFVLIEFQGDHLNGDAGAALLDLVDAGTIRIWDLLVVTKADDGTVQGINIEDLDAEHLGSFTAFVGAESGLLSDDDAAEAGNALEPGTVAALIVYENTWAIPFVKAARAAGGQVVAAARIPADTVIEVLDAADAAS
jgi:hypothetical protein